jgi:hypothetical protein
LNSCKIHYEALYVPEINQGNRIKIINFSKGFLCSIDEVRMIEKINLLMDAEAQQQRVGCSLVTSQGYTSFNDALSLSQYGGSKKRKLISSVKRKNKCVKSVKKSRTKRNGVIPSYM